MRFIILLFIILDFIPCMGQVDFVVLKDSSTINTLRYRQNIPREATSTDLTDDEWTLVKEIEKECIENYNSGIKKSFKKRGERRKYSKMYQIMNIDKYKIQYVPYLNEKGEKEIWINGFCDDFDTAWRNEILYVFDGGHCYFTIRINISTGECLGIGINGYS